MQIASHTRILALLKKLISPIMKRLFPDVKREDKAYDEISMNMVANVMGLGNAATPLGLKAMKSMQEENKNKDTLSDSMFMFIVVNTASLQIIPTTVIAIRSSLGSINPTGMILAVWIATVCAFLAATISAKFFLKKR